MSLSKIKEFILKNDNFAVIGHLNPDGDCIGSCMSMWYLLKKLGKTAYVILEDEDIPDYLKFLWDSGAKADDNAHFDAYIALDCAAPDRLIRLGEDFAKSQNTACIDHHRTNSGFAKVNAVIPDAAATGEIIYYLATEQFGITLGGEMAECMYAAISADSGSFKYSSTTSATMKAGAALLDCGVDNAAIAKKLFDTYKKEQIDIIADITATLETYFDGKVASICITDELLESKGLTFDQVDFIVGLPRAIEGVEVGLLFKKRGDEVKVSMRSNHYADVSIVAANLGGGGHARAAGITLKCSLDKAKDIILKELEKVILN